MSTFLENLGAGALWAALALPILVASVGDVSSRDPHSRHGVLMWPLFFAASVFLVPWVRQVWSVGAPLEVPQAVPLALVTGSAVASPEMPAVSWSLLEGVGLLFVGLLAAVVARHAIRLMALQWVLWRTVEASGLIRGEVEAQATRLGVTTPRVVVSSDISVPFVVGAWRPKLVWPARLLETLSGPERALVVQHELTHLARGDHRLAPVLAWLQLFFPFHPTARRLFKELAVAREEAVDVSIHQDQRHAYAQLLVRVAAFANEGPRFEVGMADGSLKRRIDALTNIGPKPLARLGPVTLVGTLILGLLVMAPKAVLAGEQPAASEPKKTSPHEVDLTPTFSLVTGQSISVTIKGITRLAMGDPSVCDVTVGAGGQLKLKALAPGTTTLLVWTTGNQHEAYRIKVDKSR